MNKKQIRKSKSSRGKWSITTERYVAYIDIMGFKDMVTNTQHNEIYSTMKKVNNKIKIIENVKWGGVNAKLVKTTTYSDSYMIYSKDSSYDSLYSIVCTIAGLSDTLFLEGIPHKGVLSFGEMTLDQYRSIYFGEPLINSYLLQDEIHFYGIVIHASADIEIYNASNGKAYPFVYRYLCPFKKGSTYHSTICPMHATVRNSPKFSYKYSRLVNSINNLKYKTSGHLRQYIDNTQDYIKFIDSEQ